MKFSSKQICCTRSVHDQIMSDTEFGEFVTKSLDRHFEADWGNLTEEDKLANDQALITNERVMSSYVHEKSGKKIWIITECDRSVSTVLFPEEY
jgi:hypothetical protein